ncbi:glycosyltransferase family 2 protein [Jatrophihabitans endophyticus]|uniref:glycosyltransferase family 2 protein n=1 Tax=Jatrophihabitans endophyticus TaxID=1206085 RepID=UPI0034CD3E5C
MDQVPPELDIVLPCLDEAQALPWVLERIPAGARAVVVDNGSRDGSPDVARAGGATVVTCDRRGYGAACHAGLEAAEAEFVAFCDCDASLDPADALRLVDLLRAGADLAVGRRVPAARGVWPLHARLANVELARRVRRRTGVGLRDVGPLRAARREPLLGLPIADRRSGYPVETVVRASEAGWRIEQVDVGYSPRAGRSKVTGTLHGTVQAVRDMSRVLRE